MLNSTEMETSPRKMDVLSPQTATQDVIELLTAAQEVDFWEDVLSKSGDTPLTSLLKGVETVELDAIYPEEPVEDEENGSLYYFHAHSDRPEEYGHIHTYVMEPGIPDGIRAIAPATHGEHADPLRTHCHIAGISLDNHGKPKELFTINHWSSQEARYSVSDLDQILSSFDIAHAVPSYPANRWVSAMLRLFRNEIIELFVKREEFLAIAGKNEPEVPPGENEAFDVTSSISISVEDKIREVSELAIEHGLLK